MAGEMAICGIPNALEGGNSAIGQGSGVAVAGGSHADQEPSSVSIATSRSPEYATFQTVCPRSTPLDFIAMVNHNLDRARGSHYRAIAAQATSSSPSLTARHLQVLAPKFSGALNSTTGAGTGSPTADDPPWTDEYEVNGLYGTLHGTFETPAKTLSLNPNSQAFVVRAISFAEPPLPSAITVKVLESSAEKATLTTALPIDVYDTLGRKLFIFPWSATILAASSGANVEILIETANSDSTIVVGCAWVAGFDPGNDAYDSGWVEIEEPSDVNFGSLPPSIGAASEPQAAELHLFSSTFTPYLDSFGYSGVAMVSLIDAGLDNRLPRIGVLVSGTAWRPRSDKNFVGLSFGVEDLSTVVATGGGQRLGRSRRRLRKVGFTLPRLTRSELAQLFQRIDWTKGTLGAFLIALYPEDPYLKNLSTIWVTLAQGESQPFTLSATSVENDEDTVPFRFDKSYSCLEKP